MHFATAILERPYGKACRANFTPPSKNGRRNGQRMRCQALRALRESSGPKITAFAPGLCVARAQPMRNPYATPSSEPLDARRREPR